MRPPRRRRHRQGGARGGERQAADGVQAVPRSPSWPRTLVFCRWQVTAASHVQAGQKQCQGADSAAWGGVGKCQCSHWFWVWPPKFGVYRYVYEYNPQSLRCTNSQYHIAPTRSLRNCLLTRSSLTCLVFPIFLICHHPFLIIRSTTGRMRFATTIWNQFASSNPTCGFCRGVVA